MEKLKINEKINMQFLSDLSFSIDSDEVWNDLCSHNESDMNFTISSDEVWNDLCSHNEKEEDSILPIKFQLIPSLDHISSLLNDKIHFQLEAL